MTYYYTEQKDSGVTIVVSEDRGGVKRAAVPMSIKCGPFHTLRDLQEHLTGRVCARGGNGTLFHVYNEAGT